MGPLLGLELTNAENTGQISSFNEDSNHSARLAPLLGTKTSEIVENARRSSTRRSPKRVCYGKLLRETDLSSPRKPQKSVLDGSRGCYLARSARCRTSTSSNFILHTASFSASMR